LTVRVDRLQPVDLRGRQPCPAGVLQGSARSPSRAKATWSSISADRRHRDPAVALRQQRTFSRQAADRLAHRGHPGPKIGDQTLNRHRRTRRQMAEQDHVAQPRIGDLVAGILRAVCVHRFLPLLEALYARICPQSRCDQIIGPRPRPMTGA
jgi:hypothetical protein